MPWAGGVLDAGYAAGGDTASAVFGGGVYMMDDPVSQDFFFCESKHYVFRMGDWRGEVLVFIH